MGVRGAFGINRLLCVDVVSLGAHPNEGGRGEVRESLYRAKGTPTPAVSGDVWLRSVVRRDYRTIPEFVGGGSGAFGGGWEGGGGPKAGQG